MATLSHSCNIAKGGKKVPKVCWWGCKRRPSTLLTGVAETVTGDGAITILAFVFTAFCFFCGGDASGDATACAASGLTTERSRRELSIILCINGSTCLASMYLRESARFGLITVYIFKTLEKCPDKI